MGTTATIRVSTVKVLAKRGETSQGFCLGQPPRVCNFVGSESSRELARHGLQPSMCWLPTSSDDFVSQRALSFLNASVPFEEFTSRLSDGCTVGCKRVVMEHLVEAGWEFSAAARGEDAAEMCGRSRHVQQAPSQQTPARMRRAISPSPSQTRRVEAVESVAKVDDMSSEEASGDLDTDPSKTFARESWSRLDMAPSARTRDTTNVGSGEDLRLPCVPSCKIPSCSTTVNQGNGRKLCTSSAKEAPCTQW